MAESRELSYTIKNQSELNLSYIPFIKDGGLFIPTQENFSLGDLVTVELKLPDQLNIQKISGKIVWITPKNALYQIFPGVGIQFIGENAKSIQQQIVSNLDNSMDVGGFAYGMLGEGGKSNPPKKKLGK